MQSSREEQREIRKQNEQCKKKRKTIEWETRDIFKKIRYQGNISCKVGHNKRQKWYGPNQSRRD